MGRFYKKYAKLVAFLQVLTAVLVGACSIWYGAWYPDAQTRLHDEWKKNSPKVVVDKPNFWLTSLSEVSWSSPVGYTIGLLLLAFASGTGVLINAIRLEHLEKREVEFDREQEAHAETQRYYYDALKAHLIHFFGAQIPTFDNSCRASVYRHDAAAKVFRMVFRHSEIQRFERKGRAAIPEDEGVLGATFLNGSHVYISDLPTRKPRTAGTPYCRATNEKLAVFGVEISKTAVAQLNMPSRCYFGYAIRDSLTTEKFAILILESTNANQFNVQIINTLLQAQNPKIVEYVRHIAHLDSKLNPYGVIR
jgi:hypothetical protein